jgi:hypothetical protein
MVLGSALSLSSRICRELGQIRRQEENHDRLFTVSIVERTDTVLGLDSTPILPAQL